MKTILLMGNPNVGKSVVFSRLTGANVLASNYPGTTVDFTKGYIRRNGDKWEVIDVPGSYSLSPHNPAEDVAVRMLDQGDLVINVLDATNLERNLFLTLEILEKDVPTVVVLNLWDEARHKGIHIDAEKLESLLGVPVVHTVALTGEGISELVETLRRARAGEKTPGGDDQHWARIGQIVNQVQTVEHRHHTLGERISDATISPISGIPVAVLAVAFCFFFVRLIGESLISYVTDPIFELYRPVPLALSKWLGGGGIIHDILIGKLQNGDIEYMESMGLLTTGLYVPLAAVLPYIISFYLILSVLEDSGYLPRLATLVDNIFHKLGMHGHAIVTVLLGLGCNVPGALATRNLPTRKQRFIACVLLGISVPCMAQIAMVFGILGKYGIRYLVIVFGTLVLVYIIGGLLMSRLVRGESPELFLEIPPYRRPSFVAVLKKTYMRIRWFITEAVPWLFLGVALVNLLYAMRVIHFLGVAFAPVVEGWMGLPGEAGVALLIGFLRKDLAVGVLIALGMSPMQLTIACIILTICFPCVATFAVMLKELGPKDMLKAGAIMVCSALLVGGIMRVVLL